MTNSLRPWRPHFPQLMLLALQSHTGKPLWPPRSYFHSCLPPRLSRPLRFSGLFDSSRDASSAEDAPVHYSISSQPVISVLLGCNTTPTFSRLRPEGIPTSILPFFLPSFSSLLGKPVVSRQLWVPAVKLLQLFQPSF